MSRVGKGGKGWLEANIDFKHCHLSYVEVIPGILKEKKEKKREYKLRLVRFTETKGGERVYSTGWKGKNDVKTLEREKTRQPPRQ